MSELAKKKFVPSKENVPALKGHEKAANKKRLQPAKDQMNDSDAIERAVYDGMQDLRAKKVSA